MNKQNDSLIKDIIPASGSPSVCNQSLSDSSSVQQDKLSVVKGFTLLEVMIVTTILATLATTTVVALNPVELLAQTRDPEADAIGRSTADTLRMSGIRFPIGTLAGQTLRWTGTAWTANNNLFNTGTNVGIGTTNPLSRVQIQGHGTTTAGALNITDSAGTSRFFVRDDGNVGIGTTTPTSPLHVMNLPIFANNVVALERGLTAGAIYRTKAGALMVASPTSYFLFSSETTHNGNLGGRVGANNICRTSATRPAVCSAHNTWAFISISYADEIRDFPSTMPAWTGGSAFNPLYAWYWRNGTHAGILAANSWADLMDRSILNSGMAGGIPNEIHWTGSSGEGLWADNNCMNWTMASMLMGVVGNPGLVNMGGWLDDDFSSCGTRRRIYCACF